MALQDMPALGTIVQFPDPKPFWGKSGIYFLYLDGEVVYVGQARDVWKRLGQHMAEGKKWFDGVSVLECPIPQLEATERRYIRLLTPRYNNCPEARQAKRYAKQGIRLPLSRGKLDAHSAAEFLGVSVDQFLEFKVRQIRMRDRRRTGTYRADDLRVFAESNPDLLAAARAKSA